MLSAVRAAGCSAHRFLLPVLHRGGEGGNEVAVAPAGARDPHPQLPEPHPGEPAAHQGAPLQSQVTASTSQVRWPLPFSSPEPAPVDGEGAPRLQPAAGSGALAAGAAGSLPPHPGGGRPLGGRGRGRTGSEVSQQPTGPRAPAPACDFFFFF